MQVAVGAPKMKRIEKRSYDKNGNLCITTKPRLIDKYWSRVKMKFKKFHQPMCCCYWCLKKRFTSKTTCPKCKKRKLRMSGWHISYVNKPHESGTHYHCKCGFTTKNES